MSAKGRLEDLWMDVPEERPPSGYYARKAIEEIGSDVDVSS